MDALKAKSRTGGQQGVQLEEDEDEDMEDRPLKDTFGALVKNCKMLQIVGPACVFLKQGFALVCNRTQTTLQTPSATFLSFHLHLRLTLTSF